MDLQIAVERQTIVSMLRGFSRWVILIVCAATLCTFATGCILVIAGAAASQKYSVDPEFAKKYDFNFKQPSIKKKVVLYFEVKGSDGLPKGQYRKAFPDAVRNSGAFSEVAEAKNEHDLLTYPDWDVMRIQMKCLGENVHGRNDELKYEVKVRFEFQTLGEPVEYVYSVAAWQTSYGGQPPTDAAHPLMGRDQAAGLFAQEVVLAACAEAQRSGRYFQ